MRLASILGIKVMPVVQHYDKDQYSPDVAFASYRQFVKSSGKILAQKGGVVCIAPEGTRSEHSSLQPAQRGLGLVARSGSEPVGLCFAPMAIIPQGSFSRDLRLKWDHFLACQISLQQLMLKKETDR